MRTLRILLLMLLPVIGIAQQGEYKFEQRRYGDYNFLTLGIDNTYTSFSSTSFIWGWDYVKIEGKTYKELYLINSKPVINILDENQLLFTYRLEGRRLLFLWYDTKQQRVVKLSLLNLKTGKVLSLS